jgi:hypothetical protein
MQIRIEVKTPAGQAVGTEKKLRLFILGKLGKLPETYVSPDEDKFAWIVEADERRAAKITRNLAFFGKIASQALDQVEQNKVFKKLGAASAEDVSQLRKMFDATTVRRVMNLEAEQHDDEEPSWLEKVRGWWDKR